MNINSLCRNRIHSYVYSGEIQFLVIKKFVCLAVIKNSRESGQIVMNLFALGN